jgi:hypothetical protein
MGEYLKMLKECVEASMALDNRVRELDREGLIIRRLGEKNLARLEAIMEISGKTEEVLEVELAKWMEDNNEKINLNFSDVYTGLLNKFITNQNRATAPTESANTAESRTGSDNTNMPSE